METTEIIEKVKNVIRDILDLETIEIAPETELITIEGWDSLTQINLFSSLSHEFSIKFTIDDMGRMKTVSNLIEVIRGKLQHN